MRREQICWREAFGVAVAHDRIRSALVGDDCDCGSAGRVAWEVNGWRSRVHIHPARIGEVFIFVLAV